MCTDPWFIHSHPTIVLTEYFVGRLYPGPIVHLLAPSQLVHTQSCGHVWSGLVTLLGLVGYYGGSGGHCGSDGSGGCPYSSSLLAPSGALVVIMG